MKKKGREVKVGVKSVESVQNPKYVMRMLSFYGEPIEDRTWFSDDGTYMDAFKVDYDGSYTAVFGRFAPEKDIKEAIRRIADYVKVSPDSIRIRELPFWKSTYELQYEMGSDEDKVHSVDRLDLVEDALHWFHMEIKPETFRRDKTYYENKLGRIVFINLTEDMLRNLKPGSSAFVLAEIKYGSENSVLIRESDIYQPNAHSGEDQFIEYKIYEDGNYSLLQYNQKDIGMHSSRCAPTELPSRLKSGYYRGKSEILADVCLLGDIAIIIHENSKYN